jgi:thioredoxin 1
VLTPSPLWVICLCADWCGLCNDYRTLFEDLALRHPDLRFAWVDIEDEATLVGDLDIETFPTLLVADASAQRFYGTLLPHAGTLERLLAALRDAEPREHSTSTRELLAALPAAPRLWISR